MAGTMAASSPPAHSMPQASMSGQQSLSPNATGRNLVPEDKVQSTLDKLLRMMQHRHTQDAFERHGMLAQRVAGLATSEGGFALAHLPVLSDILGILVGRIQQASGDADDSGQAQAYSSDALQSLMQAMQLPFIIRTSSEQLRSFPVLTSVMSTVAACLSVGPLELRTAAARLLRVFSESGSELGAYHLQVLENSMLAEPLVQGLALALSVKPPAPPLGDSAELSLMQTSESTVTVDNGVSRHDFAQPEAELTTGIVALLSTVSSSHEVCAALVYDEQVGLLQNGSLTESLSILLKSHPRDPLVPDLVHLIWNIVELVPDSCPALAQESVLNGFSALFEAHCRIGFASRAKEVRNDLVLVLSLILRGAGPENAADAFLQSGLAETLYNVATASETMMPAELVKPFVQTNSQDDLDMKRSIIALLCELCINEDAFRWLVFEKGSFIPSQLIYVDMEMSGHPARTKLTHAQNKELQLMALSALSFVAPPAFEVFLTQDGVRCVLTLLAQESDEGVRGGCLRLILALSAVPECCLELASMGAVELMLSLVNDSDSHPLPLRQDAIAILSCLCASSPDIKVRFGELGGVHSLAANVSTSTADAARQEPFVLTIVDCIWNSIVGVQPNEETFLELRGVHSLVSVLEVCPANMQPLVLGTIIDLCGSESCREAAIKQVLEWRSRITRRNILEVALDLWDGVEEDAQDTERLARNDQEMGMNDGPAFDPAASLQEPHSPDALSSTHGIGAGNHGGGHSLDAVPEQEEEKSPQPDVEEREDVAAPSNGEFEAIVAGSNLKSKVFSFFKALRFLQAQPDDPDVSELLGAARDELSPDALFRMEKVKQYEPSCRLRLWNMVNTELQEAGIRPVTPDARHVEERISSVNAELEQLEEVESQLASDAADIEKNHEMEFYKSKIQDHNMAATNERRKRQPPRKMAHRTKIVVSKPRVPSDIAHTLVPATQQSSEAPTEAKGDAQTSETPSTTAPGGGEEVDSFLKEESVNAMLEATREMKEASQPSSDAAASQASPDSPRIASAQSSSRRPSTPGGGGLSAVRALADQSK